MQKIEKEMQKKHVVENLEIGEDKGMDAGMSLEEKGCLDARESMEWRWVHNGLCLFSAASQLILLMYINKKGQLVTRWHLWVCDQSVRTSESLREILESLWDGI